MKPKKIAYMTLVLGLFSVSGLLGNIFIFQANPEIVIEKSNFQIVPAVAYIVAFAFHVMAFLFLLSSIRNTEKHRRLKISALILVIFSIISFLVDKVMIDELADEIRSGFETDTIMLLLPLIFKVLFSLFILWIIFLGFSEKSNEAEKDEQDEKIFTVAQIIGLVTGFLGIILVLSQINSYQGKPLFSIPVYLVFLVPYGLVVLYWLLMKFQLKFKQWYDEKQWQDILKSAVITLLISIPGMAVLLFLNKPLEYFWFPYYLFLILFIFSGSTFIFYKKV